MTRNFYQTEQGNLTVLFLENTMLIWTDTPGSLMAVNPDNPGVLTSEVGEVDISGTDSPDQMLAKIRAQTGKAGWGTNRQKRPVSLINEFTTETGPGEDVTVKTIAFSSESDRQEHIIDWVENHQKMGCVRVPDEEFKFYAPKDYIYWLELPEIQFV